MTRDRFVARGLRPARVAVVSIALGCAVLSSSRADDDWWLWESPTDNAERPDQAQTVRTEYIDVMGGHPVGQTFLPRDNFLYRIDLMMHNALDRRPIHVALWEWADTNHNGVTEPGEYAATVAAPPLWRDTVSLPGPDAPVLTNFFPRIPVHAGAPYLIEIGVGDTDAEWGVYCTEGPIDRYPDGMLRANGVFQDIPPSLYFDLWFRTFGSPVELPPPPLCADTGQPAPCISAPGAWEDPAPPGPPATAADYLAIVRSTADAGRASILAGDGENADRFALYDAFLYRATSDETYAANVVSLFRKFGQRIVDHPPTEFQWGEFGGIAYKWVKDSPTLTAADHTMIKKILLKSGFELWSEREGGVFNHAFGRALTFKLITDLVPADEFAALSACEPGPPPACDGPFHSGQQLDAADHADWVAYADGRWNEFRQSYDFYEDGCMYSFLSVQMLLELIEAYGADDIWAEPRFKTLVERVYGYLTPMGALPVCGDSRGWSQYWGSPIWLFEEAAAHWRDPKYKWMAGRAYDYRRTHLKDVLANGQPIALWQAVSDELPAFCHVYFKTDASVPAIEPAGQAEQVAAKQDQAADHEWTASLQTVGQTFAATASPLVRLDVRVRNGGSSGPATVKLWTWKDSYGATVAETPLFAGTVSLFGADTAQVRSLLPFLAVAPGATYYVEFSRAAPFILEGSASGGTDRYSGGDLWVNGGAVSGADLWFRTSTLTTDGSTITMRREVSARRYSQWGVPMQWNEFGDNQVPDKLILRSGYDAGDLYALVNLVRGEWYHGQQETGAVLNLTFRGSTLLNDSNYYDQREKDQNTMLTRRHWGGTHAAATHPMTVSQFSDSRLATVAWIGWGDPSGFNVDHHRRFYFVKNRFLLVRDRTTFGEAMTASTGNIWQAHDVRPEHGTHWYSLYNREPKGLNGWLFKNPEEYLQLYMVDRNQYAFTEWSVVKNENPGSPPFKIAQRWAGQAQAGQTLWFDSLLLPYGSEITPAAAAASVNVLYDDGTNVVFKIAVGAETWTVVDNPGGLAIDRGGVATDASYLIARTSPAGPGYLLTSQASRVEINDGAARLIRFAWPVTTSVELTDTAAVQDTDGDGAPDAVDEDDDGDGVADAVDAQPFDRFHCRDVDDDGCDDCATGVDDPGSDGPDADGDVHCDAHDNCPATFNPNQSDADHDGEGDLCDVDDGLIYVLGTDDRHAVEWQSESGYTAWNSYRGSLSFLRATGQYTQAPGSNPLAGRDCGLDEPFVFDLLVPNPGEVAFNLVTGMAHGAESGLGTNSAGVPRANAHPCP